MQIIISVEDQTTAGFVRGWIVPNGTDPAADLELEAVDHVDVPVSEDEARWHQLLLAALEHDRYQLTGPLTEPVTGVLVGGVKRADS